VVWNKKKQKKGKTVFVQHKLFTKVILTKTKSKIVSLKKKGDIVFTTKVAPSWVSKTITINPELRRIIHNLSYAKIYRKRKVYKFVKKTIKKIKSSKMEKLKFALRNNNGRKIIIRNIISKKFAKGLRKVIRSFLKSKIVIEMSKSDKFKSTVEVKTNPSKITKNAVRLPKSVINNTSTKNLKKLLILKGRSKK